jgi:hypothetical protein
MHTSKDELDATVLGEYTGRSVDAAGIRIAFESMPGHFPPDESVFRGLPGDRCQCDHWGYVFRGSFRVTYPDGSQEIVRTGDAYHLRPGHFVQTLEPVELLELSPVAEHDRTMATIARNVGAVPA